MIRPAICDFCFLAFCVGLGFAQGGPRNIHGSIHDQLGYVVPGARVRIEGITTSQTTTSGNDGSFRLDGVPREKMTLSVDAPGFAHSAMSLPVEKDEVDIVLSPAPVWQEINVTANRAGTSWGDTAESVTALSRQDLDFTATEALDEALREVPGFTLFRRSDSRTANPTTQGPSLRGVGGSGAGRALVLYDEVPLNDPFGGWVYWGRVPREELNSVEILRGGGSSLYGSTALSGVVNIVPETEARNLLAAEVSAGSQGTPDVSLASSWRLRSWKLDLGGEAFRTGGYILVPADQRGSVDTAADSYHGTAELAARRKVAQGDLFLAGAFYDEARNNGTPLQTNDTQLWQLRGGLNLPTRIAGIQLRGFGSGQSYNQTFSSIAANRNSESPVRAQHVPAQQAGGSLLLARQLGARNSFVAGADTRYVRGFSNETAFAAGLATSLIDSGGRQLTSGAFMQDSIRLHPRLLFTAGVRYDNWDNYEAHTSTRPLVPTIKPSFTAFTDEGRHAFSPRGTLLFRASDRITLTASAYKSFRAPTLNELYRSFRLGNVNTLANAQLQAERLSGAEVGANLSLRAARIHTAFFWMEVSDPVSNVTLSTTPALITRERENLGRTRSAGVEADADWRFKRLDLIAGYQFVDPVVTSFFANPVLVGLDIPQVARHQFTLQTRYGFAQGWTLSTQARASSRQFDDDLNQFPLDSFFQLDTYVSKRLQHGVDVFAAVENLFNMQIQVARTPQVNLGPPIFARAGVRFRFE
jgi:outer membrane receptor protein involved in Fe transport